MKANIEFKKIIYFISIICLFIFNSCGLEDYIYISPPRTVWNPPEYDTQNILRSITFETNEKENVNDAFLGTAVYYKIYNKCATMRSRSSSITSLISSTNESASAVKMIESYGYKQLCLNTGLESPLIPKLN